MTIKIPTFDGPAAAALSHPRADVGTLGALRVVLAWRVRHWRRWFALPSRGTCSCCCLTGRCARGVEFSKLFWVTSGSFWLTLAHFLASNPPSLHPISLSPVKPKSTERLALAHQARPSLYRIDCSSIISLSPSTLVTLFASTTSPRGLCVRFPSDLDQDNACC